MNTEQERMHIKYFDKIYTSYERVSLNFVRVPGSNSELGFKGTVSREWIGPCIVLMDRR